MICTPSVFFFCIFVFLIPIQKIFNRNMKIQMIYPTERKKQGKVKGNQWITNFSTKYTLCVVGYVLFDVTFYICIYILFLSICYVCLFSFGI